LTERVNSGCCICGADYGRYGHNPDPVKPSGRCCDTCNATVVIPARLSMMGFRAEGPEESVCDTCGSEGKNPNLRDGYCDDCVCSGCYDRPISGSEYAYCERCYEKNNPSHENWDRSDYWAETFEAEDSADCSSCGENLEDYGSIQCSDCAEDGCGACSCSDCDRCDDCCLCKCSVCGDKDWQMTDTKEGNVCRGCYVYCFKCSSRQHPEGMAAHEICNSCAEDMNRCEACGDYMDEDDAVSCVECSDTYCNWCSDEPENMTRTEDDEEPLCRDCAPMELNAEDEQDKILAQMYEIEDKAKPSKEDIKNYTNLETRMYELTRMRSEEGSTPIMNPMEFGEMVNWRPLDGTPSLKRQRAEDDGEGIQMEHCESCQELTDVEELYTSADGNEILCDECYTVDMSERDHDAEGVSEEVTGRLRKMAVGFTGMTVVFTAIGAVGGYLLGRNTKR